MSKTENGNNSQGTEKQANSHHIGILEKLKEKIIKESWTKDK